MGGLFKLFTKGISMNNRLKPLLISLLTLISINSHAAEDNAGTIHFTGEIIEPSCEITGDDGTDSTVGLGSYPVSLFTAPGVESDLTPFSINLDNCPVQSDGLPSIQLTFTGTSALTGDPTLLDVSKISTTGTTAATGVGIAISEAGKDSTLIKMDSSEGQIYVPLSTKSGSTINADLNARYISFKDTVTAGPADGDLIVNIVYH
jgi:type 1 fimbrial protein